MWSTAYDDMVTNWLGNSDINSIMKKHFTNDKGELIFDFANYKDRVKLGKELIKVLHEKDKK